MSLCQSQIVDCELLAEIRLSEVDRLATALVDPKIKTRDVIRPESEAPE